MNGYAATPSASSTTANERFWVKFHFKTEQGHRFYTDEEAATAVGQGQRDQPGGSVQRHRAGTSRAGRSMCR